VRTSVRYEAAADGVVPGQFVVGAVYAVGAYGVVPLPPMVLLLALAHLVAPVAFIVGRSEAERNLDTLDEHYQAQMGTGEEPDPEMQVGDLGGPAVGSSSGSLKRRVLFFAVSTLAFSLGGVAVLYAA
jgi:hypothetical protein